MECPKELEDIFSDYKLTEVGMMPSTGFIFKYFDMLSDTLVYTLNELYKLKYETGKIFFQRTLLSIAETSPAGCTQGNIKKKTNSEFIN